MATTLFEAAIGAELPWAYTRRGGEEKVIHDQAEDDYAPEDLQSFIDLVQSSMPAGIKPRAAGKQLGVTAHRAQRLANRIGYPLYQDDGGAFMWVEVE